MVGADNKVQLRRVEVGPVTGEERVITKGLSPGERVVGEAATLYQRVLSQEKENPVALHLLGVLHHQRGDNAKAIELISRAVLLVAAHPARVAATTRPSPAERAALLQVMVI